MTAKRKAKAVVNALSTFQKSSGVPTVKCFEVGCKDYTVEPEDFVLDYKEIDLAAEIAKYNRETAARRKSA